jgi:Uma2 family endonuclease
MGEPLKKAAGNYSYSDYLTWSEEERWELIDGIAYMGAAPSRKHQGVQVELIRQISNYLIDKTCRVYGAPFDVRLIKKDEENDDIKDVVQPDISIICDKSKLDDRGCIGSPDLIIEIISPGTASFDYIKKLSLYEKNEVKEYWIVHPIDEIVMVYKLDENGKYNRPGIYSRDNNINMGIFEELTIDLNRVFQE